MASLLALVVVISWPLLLRLLTLAKKVLPSGNKPGSFPGLKLLPVAPAMAHAVPSPGWRTYH